MVLILAALISAGVGTVAASAAAMVATNNKSTPSSAKKKARPPKSRFRREQRDLKNACMAPRTPLAVNTRPSTGMDVDGEDSPAAAAAAAPAPASAGSRPGQQSSFSGLGFAQTHSTPPVPRGSNGNANPTGVDFKIGLGGSVCHLFPQAPASVAPSGVPGAVGQQPQPQQQPQQQQQPPFSVPSPAQSAMSSLTGTGFSAFGEASSVARSQVVSNVSQQVLKAATESDASERKHESETLKKHLQEADKQRAEADKERQERRELLASVAKKNM